MVACDNFKDGAILIMIIARSLNLKINLMSGMALLILNFEYSTSVNIAYCVVPRPSSHNLMAPATAITEALDALHLSMI